jgi:hypothetical protein
MCIKEKFRIYRKIYIFLRDELFYKKTKLYFLYDELFYTKENWSLSWALDFAFDWLIQ